MTWRWPWVSRRAYDLVAAQLELVQTERNEYRDRGDRIYDETILRFGYEPATPRVRQENAVAAEKYQADVAQRFEDPLSIDIDEIESAVDAVIADEAKKGTTPV